LQIALVAAVAAPVPASASPSATLVEQPHSVTHGTITVDAPPAVVYALVTDYAAWPSFLHDVEWTKIESGVRRDSRVRMLTHSLGHKVTVVFDNIEDRAIRFKLVDGPPGARASGEYILDPIDNGTRTRIAATVYMDVVGLPSLVVGSSKVRGMRQAKVRGDLEDSAHEIERLHAAAANSRLP
jgi:hypothetical protein